MRRVVSKVALGLLVGGAGFSAYAVGPSMVTSGMYAGYGMEINSTGMMRITTNNDHSKSYPQKDVKSPTIISQYRLGYWMPIDSSWLWGVELNYRRFPAGEYVTLVSPSDGHDETELLMASFYKSMPSVDAMVSFGMKFHRGFGYLAGGVGKVNRITPQYRNPKGVGDPVFHTQSVLGLSFKVGTAYYLNSSLFIDASYKTMTTRLSKDMFKYQKTSSSYGESDRRSLYVNSFDVSLNYLFADF